MDLPIKNGDFPLPEGIVSNFDPFSSHWVPYPPLNPFLKNPFATAWRGLGEQPRECLAGTVQRQCPAETRGRAAVSGRVAGCPWGGGEGGNLGTGGDAAGICR